MTLVGSSIWALQLADVLGLIRVTLISTVAFCVSGIGWLMFGQQREQQRVRLTLIALIALSTGVLVLLAWAQGGPLKDNYLRNPLLVESVRWWGILPLLPVCVAWRLFAGSLRKFLPVDSVASWALLGFLTLILPLAAYPKFPQTESIDEIVLAPAILLIILALFGWIFRWRALGVGPRATIMVASLAWGVSRHMGRVCNLTVSELSQRVTQR
jgi:hypothetical protein